MALSTRGATRALRASKVCLTCSDIWLLGADFPVAQSRRLSSVKQCFGPIGELTIATEYEAKRTYASAEQTLKETLASIIPEKRELFKKVKAAGGTKIGDVKIENTIGGMR